MDTGKEKLANETWKACRKIQTAIRKYGVRLWDNFKKLDEKCNGTIIPSKFIHGLKQLKSSVDLNDTEIREIMKYFTMPDGTVSYHQFCSVICEDIGIDQVFRKEDYVSGLELESTDYVNVLSNFEMRQLKVLLTKIAQSLRLREMVLLPYFQDYELLTGNVGTVTVTHFSRVLHFVGICLSIRDYRLILKRYMKDSYTVNYLAFVRDIEKTVKCLDSMRLLDQSKDVIDNFPGRVMQVNLPKLPRMDTMVLTGPDIPTHSAFKRKKCTKTIVEILLRLQRHIYINQIQTCGFFQCFDTYRTGFITKNQFLRSLDNIGVSGLHKLYLTEEELDEVCHMFAKEDDDSLIKWRYFVDYIDKVFTEKELEKKPFTIVVSPPDDVKYLPKEGHESWQDMPCTRRDFCEDIIMRLKTRIENRRLYLLPFFRDYDKNHIGYITRTQFRCAMFSNNILLSNEEVLTLEKRYSNDMGFNYMWFLEEVDPPEYALNKSNVLNDKQRMNTAKKEEEMSPADYSKCNNVAIEIVIGKIKNQMVQRRMRIIDFLKGYDPLRKYSISRDNFKRGLSNADVRLSDADCSLISDVFECPLQKDAVDYKRFCDTIDEVFTQKDLERAPLLVPLQHFASNEWLDRFLNFEERVVVSAALQKLSRKSDEISNISEAFKDFDPQNCGRINTNQLLRAFTVRGLNNLISSREFEHICKCFAIKSGPGEDFDYRSFLRILEVVRINNNKNSF